MRHGRRFARTRLRRRIFIWFGASIVVTGVVVVLVLHLLRPEGRGWAQQVERFRGFAAGRFARVWDVEAERAELARAIASDLDAGVSLFDAGHASLGDFGDGCREDAGFVIEVKEEAGPLGFVAVCPRSHSGGGWVLALTLAVAGATLWAASGRIARRLTRPLDELVRVTRDIGEGKLSTRVRLGRHHLGEVGVLAEAINDMSERIERQIADQRELLAVVSHEVRTPLTRLRVLLEMARDGAATDQTFDRIEEEVVEIDELIGQLLASSRLDFAALTMKPLDGVDLCIRALERTHVPVERLEAPESGRVSLQGDATLLSRALANVLENAQKHGGGVAAMRVRTTGGYAVFEIDDDGPGFADEVRGRAFEAFSAGGVHASREDDARGHPSLGLGLSLVRRIAVAHGGDAFVENRAPRGARVVVRIPLGDEGRPG